MRLECGLLPRRRWFVGKERPTWPLLSEAFRYTPTKDRPSRIMISLIMHGGSGLNVPSRISPSLSSWEQRKNGSRNRISPMIRMMIGISTSNGCTHYFANCSFLNLRLVSLIQSLSVSGMRNSVQPRSNSMVL